MAGPEDEARSRIAELEHRLKEAEARFDALFQENPVAMAITKADGSRFLDVNRAYSRTMLYTRAEVLAPTFHPVQVWADPEARPIVLKALREKGILEAQDIQFRRKDGKLRTLQVSIRLVHLLGEPCLLSVLQDVTQERAAREAERRAQERFSRIFAASPVAISLSRRDGVMLDGNPAFTQLTGYARETLVSPGFHAEHLYGEPGQREAIMAELQQVGVVRDVELSLRRRDGSLRTVLASLEFVDVGGDTVILGLYQDITERKRMQAEREARIANEAELDRLRRTDRFRMEFINSTAHELATPLTPLVVNLKLLQEGKLGPLVERQAHALEAARRSVDRLQRVATDMLQAADLQARAIALDRGAFDLSLAVGTAVTTHRAGALAAGVRITETVQPGLFVLADSARIQLVLGHLLGNALKFTARGGTIEVEARKAGDRARVEVKDSGIGMTREQMEGLWRPYAQVHDKSQRTDSGSGLGLYVSKGIIDLHGGQVGCSSPGPGKGSSFWFELPLASP